MKENVLLFKFRTDIGLPDLNVGDYVGLDYDDFLNQYYITKEDTMLGSQVIRNFSDEAMSLLEFVAIKDKTDISVWDGDYVIAFDHIPVEVKAINKNYIVVAPSIERQRNATDEKTHFIEQMRLWLDEGYLKEEEKEEEKEETNMFSNLSSSFGKIGSDQFKLSINGLAVRGKDGKYLTFNPETRELVEVSTGFFDDMKDLLFLMPTTELEIGDIILHQNKPYYITAVENTVVKGVDFEDAVESTLVPKTNVFGMKYYTKIFNCLGTNNVLGSDIASNPMMAYALMGGKDFDLSKIMMFQALSGQGKGIADFSENPIMLMALMSNENGKNNLSDFAKMQILSGLSAKKKGPRINRKED